MAVRLVVGRAGSGKTRRCLDAVVAAVRADPLGPPVYWVVPKQATFMTERALTCAPGVGGFVRARVVSFEALGEEILAECGGAAVPEVTALGRQMILGHLLRKHQKELRYFAQAARQSGLASKLDATFADFERNGRDAADLAALEADLAHVAQRTGQQQSLADKVHDLRLIYGAYSAYLGQERLDRHRRLAQVLACVAGSRSLRGATVYVDGFATFTEYERRVIAQLGKACRSVEVMLLMDDRSPLLANPHVVPNEVGWFHPTEQAYRQLWFTLAEEGTPVDGTVVLPRAERFRAPALAEVERQLQWRLSISQLKPDGIEMVEATTRRAEVDAVARRIRQLWREGVRLRDIAVLVRDLEPYHELISASFREHEIEYFVDRRRQVGHHPLVQFLRAALSVAQSAWPHDAVMTILKSGLSGLKDEDADDLENYVLEHRIRGTVWTQPEPWDYARAMLAPEDEAGRRATARALRIDALRRQMVGRLTPFVKKVSADGLTLRAVVVAVFELFKAFGVERRLTEWMAEAHAQRRLEQRDEHGQVWKNLVDLFDQMVELLGDEPATLADFVEIVEAGLEQFDLALAPPTTDEVLVGQVDRTRCPGDLRACIVMGLNEGVFPRMPSEDSVLSDAERRELRERDVEVDADTPRRLLDENLLGYIALTRAGERLILTRSKTDAGGKELGASQYWRRVRELFPKTEVREVGDAQGLEGIGTPRQLVVRLMEWVRGGEGEGSGAKSQEPGEAADGAAYAALYQWLATHPAGGDSVDTMRFRAWRALSYGNQAKLSRELAGRLFPSPLHASVTRIESFAACPFKHFARYGLELRPREDEDGVSALDLGNVYHHVLEHVVASMLERKQRWQDVPAEERAALIHAVAQDVGQRLRGEILLSSARNRFMLQRIEETLAEVTAGQAAAARRGAFAPAFAELTFGGSGGELPGLEIVTPHHKAVVLQGKIDRVDVCAEEAAVAVIDYKLSGNALQLDRVYHGLSLQLLTYLLVLRENGERLTGGKLTPAAAFYVKLLRQLEDVKHPDECADPEVADLREKPRGIFDGSHLKYLDCQCTQGPSQVVNAYVKGDGSHGNKGRSDAAETAEFAALIDHVRARIGELADGILEGRVELHPFMIRGQSPCPRCEFRPVCRFDAGLNRYHHLDGIGREEVLRRVVQVNVRGGGGSGKEEDPSPLPSPTAGAVVGEGASPAALGEGVAVGVTRPRSRKGVKK
jgi:ATP-dependent helicase/nuclease subunit B